MSSIHHVAIIMDGNGRWAKLKNRPRVWGHIRGAGVVSKIVEKANDMGIKSLTLFAFSTENWSRPQDEIDTLFILLQKFLHRERQNLIKNGIRFRVVGSISHLTRQTQQLIKQIQQETQSNDGLNLSIAFDYGGRWEIVQAVNAFLEKNPEKPITEEDIDNFLLTKEIGDVDLLIRTSGEQRISNFLIWQSAYAELYFCPTLWPDFTPHQLTQIIQEVSLRDRRFGHSERAPGLKSIQNKAQKSKLTYQTKNTKVNT